ncbi:unnamed protein product [Anisakis simplex]|uniref:Uncharacterized protein n=1 Tax=Anisakis simplex TaxID=6269 RepID=A0A0M3K1L7_ANISI|nr:unnamed protein product [Anisakis simplex]
MLQVIVILVIAIQRQIFRLRNNNVRREQNISIGVGMTKNQRNEVLKRIELVRQFQLLRAPKFTEIGTIAEHANAPYINRMIALDELREIDRQLEFVNADLVRSAGESTYLYLTRMKQVALPTLPEQLIERLGFLAEHCRFRHQPFTEKELKEVRALIKDVVRILNSEQQRLSALHLKPSDTGSGVGPVLSASLHTISKRLSAGENKLHVRKRSGSGGNSQRRSASMSKRSRSKAGRDSFHLTNWEVVFGYCYRYGIHFGWLICNVLMRNMLLIFYNFVAWGIGFAGAVATLHLLSALSMKKKSKQFCDYNQIERPKQQWYPRPAHSVLHRQDHSLSSPQNDSDYESSSALIISSFYEHDPPPHRKLDATQSANSESIPLITQCLRNRSATFDSQNRKNLQTSSERLPLLLQTSVNSSSS